MYTLYSRIGSMRMINENKIFDLIHNEIACLRCKVHTLMNENGNLQLAFSNKSLEMQQVHVCMKEN
jgi:hypothetical protein